MLDDKSINKLAQPIVDSFIALETELLRWIAQRFTLYEYVGGDLEWKLNQLARLGALDERAIRIIATYSELTQKQVYDAIKNAGIQSIDFKSLRKAYDGGITRISIDNLLFDDVVANVYGSVQGEMRLMFQEISNRVPLEYRRILDQINLETVSGIYSYDESLKKALTKLSEKGISAMTYQRTVTDSLGNKLIVPVEYSIEGVARRTIVSAIARSGNSHNEKVAQELGIDHYATSQHLGARNKGIGHENHESWQGKHFQISNGEFERKTGEGLVDGLGGVNCRHIKYAFIPGVSVPIESIVSREENAKVYDLEQKQRRLERAVRAAKKQLEVAKVTKDTEFIKESTKKLMARQSAVKQFVDSNKKHLRRDYARERIQEGGD